MSLYLAEVAQAVAPGAHAVVLLDQAGWHLSKRLVIPDNVTLVPLPAKAPELNPVENVWQFMRENWLSNRVSPPTPISSTIAAPLGTSSPTSLGASCPSDCATGCIGRDQQELAFMRRVCG